MKAEKVNVVATCLYSEHKDGTCEILTLIYNDTYHIIRAVHYPLETEEVIFESFEYMYLDVIKRAEIMGLTITYDALNGGWRLYNIQWIKDGIPDVEFACISEELLNEQNT